MKSEVIVGDDELPAEVLQAIRDGRKIVAIKLLREATGLGLANAKVLVDRAAARHKQTQRGASGLREESNTGRLLTVILVLVVALALYRLIDT